MRLRSHCETTLKSPIFWFAHRRYFDTHAFYLCLQWKYAFAVMFYSLGYYNYMVYNYIGNDTSRRHTASSADFICVALAIVEECLIYVCLLYNHGSQPEDPVRRIYECGFLWKVCFNDVLDENMICDNCNINRSFGIHKDKSTAVRFSQSWSPTRKNTVDFWPFYLTL